MSKSKKTFFTVLFLSVFAFTTSCGYILYPNRRGGSRGGGQVDVAVVVMDCLWLIPGILPGVIALLVDGITGAWYQSGGQSIFAAKHRTTNPKVLVAERTNTMQFKNPLKKRSAMRLYHVTSTGHRELIKSINLAPGEETRVSFSLNKKYSGDRGWLMVSFDNARQGWLDMRVATR